MRIDSARIRRDVDDEVGRRVYEDIIRGGQGRPAEATVNSAAIVGLCMAAAGGMLVGLLIGAWL